ncbi:MAG: NAD(P)H-dependent oxidoreductase [Campylobacteraceae bacterium]
MAKKILIINAHPDEKSFNFGLCEAYENGAKSSGAQIEVLNLRDLKFNPSLEFGYRKSMDLEPDLVTAQEKIKWANHLVFIHPLWWGSYPAILKGFIDRIFLPRFAYNYKDGVREKLLKYKSARIITTMDQPSWWYKYISGEPSTKQLKNITLKFCGVNPVYTNYIGIVVDSKEEKRKKWLEEVRKLGEKDAR